jgi:PAT family beta-lactamase induction signal transducer AmpG
VWCALAVAFGSATQDIALDAFRIESADTQRQAALAATYQTGYRLAMIWAGAGRAVDCRAGRSCRNAAAYQHAAWQTAYLVMAASHGGGHGDGAAVARAGAPSCRPARNWPLNGCKARWWSRLPTFIRRYRWQAALILGLIAVYRISDVVMGIMANPFYVDMGYTKDEVAAVTKVYGVIMTLAGRVPGRRAVHALWRDARADAGRHPERGQQPAVCLAGRARPRCDRR